MSNDLMTLSGNLPDYLRAAEADSITKSLAGGGNALKRISIKGRVWRLMEGNKEIAKNESLSVQLVIADAAPATARTWYSKAYDSKAEGVVPDCWSPDGEVPSQKSKARQADRCRDCPKSIRGSASNGQGAACRIQHRVAVSLPGDPNEFFQMIFPATSLLGEEKNGYMPLKMYANKLSNNRPAIPISAVITELKFDTDAETPKVMFKPIGYLPQGEYEALRAKREAGETKPYIEMDFDVADQEPTPAPAVAAAVAAPIPTQAPASPSPFPAAVPVFVQQAATVPMPQVAQPVVATAPIPEPTVVEPAKAAPTTTSDDKDAKLREILSKFGAKPTV